MDPRCSPADRRSSPWFWSYSGISRAELGRVTGGHWTHSGSLNLRSPLPFSASSFNLQYVSSNREQIQIRVANANLLLLVGCQNKQLLVGFLTRHPVMCRLLCVCHWISEVMSCQRDSLILVVGKFYDNLTWILVAAETKSFYTQVESMRSIKNWHPTCNVLVDLYIWSIHYYWWIS